MVKIKNDEAFSEKVALVANQCVTPTNCSCTCRKCMDKLLEVTYDVKKIYCEKR